jgi:hypothetical protein
VGISGDMAKSITDTISDNHYSNGNRANYSSGSEPSRLQTAPHPQEPWTQLYGWWETGQKHICSNLLP